MSFTLQSIVRPHILEMKPYSSAREEFRGDQMVFLDANENNQGSVGGGGWNRYPDPLQLELKAKIAEQQGITPKQIFLGNGSDEAIDLLIRLVCVPGQDTVLTQPPTYGMYKVSAALNEVGVQEVPLNEALQLEPERILEAVRPTTKIIFVCSPNNPTGNALSLPAIRQMTNNFEGLVVLDEAYQDFSTQPSGVGLLDQHPNLVILRTFSKAWGLAGIRLGAALGSPELIALLTKIKPPYNVNAATQKIAAAALERVAEKEKLVTTIREHREHLRTALEQLPVVETIFPSEANFLLVRFRQEARPIYEHLRQNGVVVRDRSRELHCRNGLRISVGTAEENAELIRTLRRLG